MDTRGRGRFVLCTAAYLTGKRNPAERASIHLGSGHPCAAVDLPKKLPRLRRTTMVSFNTHWYLTGKSASVIAVRDCSHLSSPRALPQLGVLLT
jgi:hypothetical protein